MSARASVAAVRRRRRWTVRLRFTVLYGGLVMASGVALLAITYALFDSATRESSVSVRLPAGGDRSASGDPPGTGQVPEPPDIGASGVDPEVPEFVAAEEACSHLLPLPLDPGPRDGPARTGASGWTRIVPGGECMGADGSEFSFWERPANPSKVVLYLEGGGICTDATTCAFTGNGENEIYKWALAVNNPASNGIFAFDRADNPFADHSFVYVPMCTGDLYLGNATREYSPDLTVEHKGSVNARAALSYLAEHYPAATEFVVVGETAGGAATPPHRTSGVVTGAITIASTSTSVRV
jgi:hypothetical protein